MTLDTLLAGCVSRNDLAKALGVCARSISRYESRPNGLPSMVIGGRKLYRLESVRAWIDAQERRPNPRRQRRAA
jgi:hypothetical protein